MLEKLKNSGKLPLIIGGILTVIIIITIAIIIGININKTQKTNANTNISDATNDEEMENDDILTVIIDKEPEEETKEPQEEPERQQETPKVEPKYFIRVNYGANVVTIYTKDSNGEYTVPYKAMVCSTGKATPKSGTYEMPSGTYSRGTWGLMVGNVWAQYFTRIKGSILFHSVPYTARNKWSLEYWEYDKLGTTASAGCVRLTVENAKWIYNNCPSGTKVEFYSDSNPGPLGKPTAQKISEHEAVRNWDPTDPDASNPWKTYTPPQKDEVPENNDEGTTPTTPTTPITPGQDNIPEEGTTPPGDGDKTEEGTTTPGDDDKTEEGTIPPGEDDKVEEGTTPPGEDDKAEEGTTTPEKDDTTGEVTTTPSKDNTTQEGTITPAKPEMSDDESNSSENKKKETTSNGENV